jgi:hypothetical protein
MISEPTYSFFERKEVWALLGILLGYALTEGTRFVRSVLERRKLRKALFDELEINYYQLEHKKNTVDNILADLKKKRILPGSSVPAASAIYETNLASVIRLLKPIERDVVQNIYARLRIIDTFLDEFEHKLIAALKDKIASNPWLAYETMLNDLRETCEATQELIKSLSDKKPIDIYGRKKTTPLSDRKFGGVVTPEIIRKQRDA